jgi:hypothetical protein
MVEGGEREGDREGNTMVNRPFTAMTGHRKCGNARREKVEEQRGGWERRKGGTGYKIEKGVCEGHTCS